VQYKPLTPLSPPPPPLCVYRQALELRRAGLLGMHAALSLLIALVVKLKISRSEAEAAAGGVRQGTAALRVRASAGGRYKLFIKYFATELYCKNCMFCIQ